MTGVKYLFILGDWRCDQYRWFQNGYKSIPKQSPKVKKYYFNVMNTDGSNSKEFQKIVYHLLDNPNLFLIQYIGDDSQAVNFPHGNSKVEGSHSYVRTCPSVIQKIKDSDPSEFPSTFYKKSLSTTSCHSTLNPVLQIRNTRQVINHKSLQRQKTRLTHDGLYNIHEIAFDLDGFVSKIITYPDLVIVCSHPKLLMEMNNLLQIGAIHGQLFSYDTTFELGDIYVSALLMRHILFQGAPVVPVSFLLHERKLESSHEELMKFIAINFPILGKCNDCAKFPLVTDEERAICAAIDKWLPGFARLRCWNHTFSAARFWLRRHGATSKEIPVYLEDLRSLFHTISPEEYHTGLEEVKVSCENTFLCVKEPVQI